MATTAKNSGNLFDPDRARGPRPGPDVGEFEPVEDLVPKPAGPITVSALVARIKSALADSFGQRLTVVGEMSNCKLHSSGHLYFRLKDSGAAIDAVMWRRDLARLKFKPADGLEVIADGRLDVYEVRGQLQFYAEQMSPKGAGALELAFRQLTEKLEAEGLFDPAAKKPIPRFPRAIGVVTSPTGAAIRDIHRTLRRRWPAARIYLFGSLVQGEGAAENIALAVRLLDANAERFGIDTIIVSRGGGSLEDLWAFNEESVARAVFAARTPIISGVGHEVDVTICDLVADVRAATPTAAAELAAPDSRQVAQHISQLSQRLGRRLSERLALARTRLDAVGRSQVFRDPKARIRTQTQRLDELSFRLAAGARHIIAGRRGRLEPPAHRLARLHPQRLVERAKAGLNRFEGRLLAVHPVNRLKLAGQRVAAAGRQLEAMGYRNVLKRGYSVTRGPAGQILRSAGQVNAGDPIETELIDGRIKSKVAGSASASPPAKRPRQIKRDQPGLFDNKNNQ